MTVCLMKMLKTQANLFGVLATNLLLPRSLNGHCVDQIKHSNAG